MSWDTRRKIIYALAVTIALLAVGLFLLRDTLFPSPTCFDSKQNGFEIGVDCGGVCALRCSQEVKPLSVLWAKVIESNKGTYDFVGMVTNRNIDNASLEFGYIFTMYDETGASLGVITGSTTAPLDGSFPIIIQDVPLEKPPTSVTMTPIDGPHYKVLENPVSPTIKVLNKYYEAGSVPRVYATIANTKHVEINNLPVKVLLFDEENNVYAVGQTIVPKLDKEGVSQIVFTWKRPLPFPPTKINLYPMFNPFDAIDH